jgi:hypothetical protein
VPSPSAGEAGGLQRFLPAAVGQKRIPDDVIGQLFQVLLAPLPHGFLPAVDDDEIDEINTRMASLRVASEWGFGRWEALFPGYAKFREEIYWLSKRALLFRIWFHFWCAMSAPVWSPMHCAVLRLCTSSCRRISHRAGLAFLVIYISNLLIII